MSETIKMGDIASCHEALTNLATSKAPLSFAITVKKNIQVLRPLSEAFHEARQEVYKEFGTEKDGQIIVSNKKQKEFAAAVKILVDEEFDVDGLRHFTLAELEELDGKVEFSGQDLLDLDCILDE